MLCLRHYYYVLPQKINLWRDIFKYCNNFLLNTVLSDLLVIIIIINWFWDTFHKVNIFLVLKYYTVVIYINIISSRYLYYNLIVIEGLYLEFLLVYYYVTIKIWYETANVQSIFPFYYYVTIYLYKPELSKFILNYNFSWKIFMINRLSSFFLYRLSVSCCTFKFYILKNYFYYYPRGSVFFEECIGTYIIFICNLSFSQAY